MVKEVLRAVPLAALLAAPLASPARAEADLKDLAKTIVSAASERGVKRVAVVPFTGARGAASYSGAVVSERLVIQILARGDLDLVERRLLEKVLEEQRLGVYGIMDPATVKALGKVLSVDAILMGSVVELKRERVEVNARLIHAETAQVLAAASARADRDWEDRPAEDSSTWVVPVPELPDERPLSGGACNGRADELEKDLLELKVRYWTARLKDPSFSPRSLTKNPGSEIADLETRRRFYQLLNERYDSDAPTAPLTVMERAKLARGLQEIAVLRQTCGG